MTTQVDIANRALSAIGIRALIVNLTDSTDEAQVMNLHYDRALQTALAAYDWSFARQRWLLTPPTGGTTAAVGWTNIYTMPPNTVQFRGIFNGFAWGLPPKVPFEVFSGGDASGNPVSLIGCNTANAVGIITYLNEVPSSYSPQFLNALPIVLASLAAFDLSAEANLVLQLEQLAQQMLASAMAVDAGTHVSDVRTQMIQRQAQQPRGQQ
jgi:hypothetical protein